MYKGATKRCCWGLCAADSRYPERLPEGTFFLPFPKPGRTRANMTVLEKTAAKRKTEKAERWQYLCGRSDFQTLDEICDNTYICSLHFEGGKGPTPEHDEPLLSEPTVERVPKRKYKATATSDASVNAKKRRCMKRMRDEQLMGKRKWQNMISGDFDFEDLQEQHIQLLKAFTEMQAEADRLRSENEKLEHALQSDFSKLSYRFVRCDNEQVLFLTGLHVVTFDWLVPKVERTIFRVHPEVTAQDHLLIVLMKLKLGLCDDDLGYRFQIHGDIITPIIQTWIPAVAAVLSPLIAWPSDNIIAKTKPSSFYRVCSRCRCILDTLEVTVATQDATTKVVSYVIGATPAGAISFVSPGFFCKKKSARQLIKESGFMDLLKPMDLLLSNKTFPIQKEIDAIEVTLLTPDGDGGKKPAVSKKREISVNVWSHVDKVMGWWKDFSVFQTPIPAAYEEMLDDLVLICAALTNVKMSLVPNVKNTKKCET